MLARFLFLISIVTTFTAAQDDLKLLFKVFEECTSDKVFSTSACLKMKVVTALDRATRSRDLEIFQDVHLVGEPSVVSTVTPDLSEKELEATLPRGLDDREAALNDIILDRMSQFIQSRSIQFKLSSLNEIPRSLNEARRRKGGGALLTYLLMMFGTMVPLKLGTLALLAGKALIVSKLALALALIVGLKKLLSGDGHESSYQVVHVPAHHSHVRRSLDLPYRAYRPKV